MGKKEKPNIEHKFPFVILNFIFDIRYFVLFIIIESSKENEIKELNE